MTLVFAKHRLYPVWRAQLTLFILEPFVALRIVRNSFTDAKIMVDNLYFEAIKNNLGCWDRIKVIIIIFNFN